MKTENGEAGSGRRLVQCAYCDEKAGFDVSLTAEIPDTDGQQVSAVNVGPCVLAITGNTSGLLMSVSMVAIAILYRRYF